MLIPKIICHRKNEHRVAYQLTKENAEQLLDFMEYKLGDDEKGQYARITDDGIEYGFHGSYDKTAKFGTIFVVEDAHDWWHNYSMAEFNEKFDVVPG